MNDPNEKYVMLRVGEDNKLSICLPSKEFIAKLIQGESFAGMMDEWPWGVDLKSWGKKWLIIKGHIVAGAMEIYGVEVAKARGEICEHCHFWDFEHVDLDDFAECGRSESRHAQSAKDFCCSAWRARE